MPLNFGAYDLVPHKIKSSKFEHTRLTETFYSYDIFLKGVTYFRTLSASILMELESDEGIAGMTKNTHLNMINFTSVSN